MSLYVSKLIASLMLPLGWVAILGLLALVMLWRGNQHVAAAMIVGQLTLLWVCAMPWTAHRLTAWLEADYPPIALGETPVADVVVVLGGALNVVGDPPTENLTSAADRVLRAARLYRAGKADYVLAVGGNLEWLAQAMPEALAMRDLLLEWGVSAAAIVTETSSQNTRENAQHAAAIIHERGWERVLLVTSATHMPRAVAAFRAAGIEVIPSPTDYGVVGTQPLDILDFLPDAGSLGGVSYALRELLGRVYYRWRGW